MLIDGCDLCELIHKGGILTDVEGSTVEELFADISKKITLPSSLDKNQFVKELLEREAVLSTAVGNGISIPHPRRPVMKEKEQERLIVCYLKNPIYMNAPDGQKVHSMFILLSQSAQFHVKALVQLAKLFRSPEFKQLIRTKPSEKDLLRLIDFLKV